MLDVANVNVSVPLLTPDMGLIFTQLAVDGTTDHLSARLPLFVTCTDWDVRLAPADPCTAIDVRSTESVGCAAAARGSMTTVRAIATPKTFEVSRPERSNMAFSRRAPLPADVSP